MSKVSVKRNGTESEAEAGRLPSLGARIRSRRVHLGLTGGELAQRAAISTSYVSLIETGAKVPDETVAAALARGLDDDEDLYRAWARAARLGVESLDLLNRLEEIGRTPSYLSLMESGQALPPLAPTREQEEAELRVRMREVASRIAPRQASAPGSEVLSVALLAEGTDPVLLDARGARRSPDCLLLDRRLLPGTDPGALFACEVTPRSLAHLRGVVAPGDRIVFHRGGVLGQDRVCAVRTPRGLVLSRVLLNDEALLLLPGDGESAFETIPVRDRRAIPDMIAGTHVLLIRR